MNDILSTSYTNSDVNVNLQTLQEQLRVQQEEFVHLQQSLIAKEPNSLSFTQGLIIGQLSVIFLIGIFVKYFVFQDASNITSGTKDSSNVVKRKDEFKNKETDRDDDSTQSIISTILEKTYYDVKNHTPETLDWFNIFIAQFIYQVRSEALVADNIFHSLNDYLLRLNFPNYLDPIKITEIDIGDDFPILSNCRIVQSTDNSTRLQAKIDVDLSDTITLGIQTRLLINYPRPFTAALPINLSVTLVRFSGCLCISIVNPNDEEFKSNVKNQVLNPEPMRTSISNNSVNGSPRKLGNDFKQTSDFKSGSSTEDSNVALMLSFSRDYRMEFTIKSLIGSRAKLEDVPKISAIIESRVRQWFVERCVEPNYRIIKLPSLWPNNVNNVKSDNIKVKSQESV